MARAWPLRAAVQGAAVAGASVLTLNAAYLVRLADQARAPGPTLARLASWGVFPFGPEAGTLSIEDYCPLGPVEGAVRFLQSAVAGTGVSFVGPVTLRNLGVLLAVAALVLLTKKTFCSWLCPFGALFEFLGWAGRRLGLPQRRPPAHLDRALRHVRHGVLAALVGMTAWGGTLLFKEVDPFYALYSLGSDARPWAAYAILGALLLAAPLLPGVWCHYLCPLSAALDPLSRLGRIRVVRASSRCTGCGACHPACPHRIPAPRRERVTDAGCTNCLRCLDACPEEALELRLEGLR